MKEVKLQALGKPGVEGLGNFSNKKALLLLTYLLLKAPENKFSSDKLNELLWSSDIFTIDPKNPLSNLYNAISKINSAYGETKDTLIQSNDSFVHLLPNVEIICDARELLNLFEDENLDWQKIQTLYQKGPFLEGMESVKGSTELINWIEGTRQEIYDAFWHTTWRAAENEPQKAKEIVEKAYTSSRKEAPVELNDFTRLYNYLSSWNSKLLGHVLRQKEELEEELGEKLELKEPYPNQITIGHISTGRIYEEPPHEYLPPEQNEEENEYQTKVIESNSDQKIDFNFPNKENETLNKTLQQMQNKLDDLTKDFANFRKLILNMVTAQDAVESEWQAEHEFPHIEQRRIALNKSILEIFDKLRSKQLLILGEPGSGKTITLYELAKGLVNRVRQKSTTPIPVIIDLKSWSNSNLDLQQWLSRELQIQLELSKEEVAYLLKNRFLLPLLDSLDQVVEDKKLACIKAINKLKKCFSGLVVCSRYEDYIPFAKQEKLKFSRAIKIEPLTDQQIEAYIKDSGPDLENLYTVVTDSKSQLKELAKNILMLDVMVRAYQGESLDEIPDFTDIEATRRRIFDKYIERVLKRQNLDPRYDEPIVRAKLTWLARNMQQHYLSDFSLGDLQPSWFDEKESKLTQFYIVVSRTLVSLGFGLFFGLFIGLTSLIVNWVSSSNLSTPINFYQGLSVGLVFSAMLAVFSSYLDRKRYLKNKSNMPLLEKVLPAVGSILLILFVWNKLHLTTIEAIASCVAVLAIFLYFVLQPTGKFGRGQIEHLDKPDLGTENHNDSNIKNPNIWASTDIQKYRHRVGLRKISPKEIQNDTLARRAITFMSIVIVFFFILGIVLSYINASSWSFAFVMTETLLFILILAIVIAGLPLKSKDFFIKEWLQDTSKHWVKLFLRQVLTKGILIGFIAALALYSLLLVVLYKTATRTNGGEELFIKEWNRIGYFAYTMIFSTFAMFSLFLSNFIDLVKHGVLHYLLTSSGHIERHYSSFLDYASERILLRKVGGSYRFLHDLLLEHFANTPKEDP